jgi:hypothetical protein
MERLVPKTELQNRFGAAPHPDVNGSESAYVTDERGVFCKVEAGDTVKTFIWNPYSRCWIPRDELHVYDEFGVRK